MNIDNFNIYYQNLQGIRTKCTNLYMNVLSNEYDILLFTETWLQSDIYSSEFCDCRYDVARQDRDLTLTGKSTGGGVMAMTRRRLGAVQRYEWSSADPELLWVTIPASTLGATANLHICVFYLPPDRDLPRRLISFWNNVSQVMNLHCHDNFLVLGDFNCSFVEWHNSGYNCLSRGSIELQNAAIETLNNLGYLGLIQYNRVLNSCNNILDLTFSNLALSVSKAPNPLIQENKYHPSLILNIPDIKMIPLKEQLRNRFIFSKGNYDRINDYLSNQDWLNILSRGTVDEATECLYSHLNHAIDLFVPKVLKSRCHYPIWYSAALIKIIREKSKAHSKWKKYKNPRDYDEFALLRSRQRRIQTLCFNNYIATAEKEIKTNPKFIWKFIKSLRGNSGYPSQFTLGRSNYSDGPSICNAFNSYFESVFAQPSTHDKVDYDYNTLCGDVIATLTFTEETVMQLLKSLDVNKGSGSDAIPPLFLVRCAPSLSLPITILFNRSLTEGTFPSIWKIANIVPVHKSGSKSCIDKYRPISKLNILSKIMEKIVYNNIYPIIIKNISTRQHGFLKGRSCVTNLAVFTNFVLENMEGGGQVDVVYTDFEKAFDRVDHDILLAKLHFLGIHGDLLRWTRSYLKNRSQAVVMGGFRSNYVSIPSGVPQGSHLGPLFYNAYIFDIHLCFGPSNHLLYADDKKVYLRIKTQEDCIALQSELNKLFEYYTRNKIKVNVKKCQTITFTRKKTPLLFNYNFNGVMIERVAMVRDLGVLLDNKLLFRNHIDLITSKAYKNLGFVIRTGKLFSQPESIKALYYAYVRSVLEFASPIWSPQYTIYQDQIERLQMKFIKYLNYQTRNNSRNYSRNCHDFKMLTLYDRRLLLDMGFLFDILRGRVDCPELLADITFNTPQYRTRHTAIFAPRAHTTNYGQNAIMTRLLRTYNNVFQDADIFHNNKLSFRSHVVQIIGDKSE